MTFDDYKKAQAALNLNLNRAVEEVVIEDEGGVKPEEDTVDAELEIMFHAQAQKKKYGKKGAKEGYKQADQVLNLKFVDENEGGDSKGKGGKGDRRQGGKGDRRQGKGNNRAQQQTGGAPKASIDLSNDSAFPTLGA